MALALSVAAAVYNNVVNRWEPFHRAAYVPVNLAFAAAMTAAAIIALDLTSGEVGCGGEGAWVLAVGFVVLVFGAGMQMLARSRYGHRIADRRVAGLRGGELVWHVLGRIPLGTALTEELVFRGVLFAVWRDAGPADVGAAVAASVAFGLWHIQPTIIGVRMNDPDAGRAKVLGAVAGAVIATTLAGLFLTWLRVEGGGLAAPILLHAGINATSAWAAAVGGRAVPRGI